MKKQIYLILTMIALVISGCSKDETDGTPNTSVKVFPLNSVTNSNIFGKISFTKNADGSTTVFLEINGSSVDVHPAFIYLGSTENPGEATITLEVIDCDCESSTTIVTALDDGTPITFEELIQYNGHVSIHQNADHMEIILAQGNIGANAE